MLIAWDTDDIDHWKIEEFKPEHLEQPFTEESSFATLFPKYREAYLRETWPLITKSLEKYVIIKFCDRSSLECGKLTQNLGHRLCFGFG
jgi:hypothetical protein